MAGIQHCSIMTTDDKTIIAHEPVVHCPALRFASLKIGTGLMHLIGFRTGLINLLEPTEVACATYAMTLEQQQGGIRCLCARRIADDIVAAL